MTEDEITAKEFKTQLFSGYDREAVRNYLNRIGRYVRQLELDKRLLEGKLDALNTELSVRQKNHGLNEIMANLEAVASLTATLKDALSRDFVHYIRLQRPDVVANFFSKQSIPWCVAAFSLLDIEHAVALLRLINAGKRAKICSQIASTKQIPQADIEAVINMTQDQFGNFVEEPTEIEHSGMESAAAFLSAMPDEDRSVTLNNIGRENPSLRKSLIHRIVVYADLETLAPRDVQTLIQRLDRDQILLAIYPEDQLDIRDLFFNNMSKRQAEDLREELNVMNPPQIERIEMARKAITDTAVELGKDGLIYVPKLNQEEDQ